MLLTFTRFKYRYLQRKATSQIYIYIYIDICRTEDEATRPKCEPDTNVDVYSKLLRWPLLASTPRQQQTEATRG